MVLTIERTKKIVKAREIIFSENIVILSLFVLKENESKEYE